MIPRRIDVPTARMVLAGVGATALAIGAGTLLLPRVGMRAIGLEADGRGLEFYARLFASRDLGIGAALLLAARQERPDPRWADLVAVLQAADLALTTQLWRAGRLSRRGLATVWLTAPPALGAACAAGIGLRRPATA